MKKKIANIIRNLGFELKPFNINTSDEALMRKILFEYNIDLVIDIGANTGQYAKNIINSGYKKKIVSLEPIKKMFNICKKSSQSYKNWDVYELAAGDRNEMKEINIAANFQSSSFLGMKTAHEEAAPYALYEGIEEVRVMTLASIYDKYHLHQYQSVLLKMDIQGYEKQVLKGGLSTFKNIKFIELELSFVELYDSAPLFNEMFELLKSYGFEFFSVVPDFRNNKTGQLLQANGIFIKKSELK